MNVGAGGNMAENVEGMVVESSQKQRYLDEYLGDGFERSMVNSKAVQIRENKIKYLQLLEAPILYQLHCDGHNVLKATTFLQPRQPHLYLRSD